jgi:glycosyltransferase involved in cell wall biosynthesis
MEPIPRQPLSILHVLTLNGAHGEYGGPNRVATELCKNLQLRGHEVRIFTGALKQSIPILRSDLKESFVIVRPLAKSFPISSLWSRKIPVSLFRQIKQVDLVHIHFARELIPITAALLCIVIKKPFVTQTHGMVIQDDRKSTKIFDFLFTRFTLNRSRTNFVLSDQEHKEIQPLSFKCQVNELPNGIAVQNLQLTRSVNQVPRIVFCSRLHSRKRPDWFLSLAKAAHNRHLVANFELYGPDNGELGQIQEQISSDPELVRVEYKGPLAPSQVFEVLSGIDLLVLPSENEPFPMIALEALSVGAPVLIMPSCGISSIFSDEFKVFVVCEETIESLVQSFVEIFENDFFRNDREKIMDFCRKHFDLDATVEKLEYVYMKVTSI